MKCSKCQKDGPIFYTKVDVSTGKSMTLCVDCEVAATPELLVAEEADGTIKELLDLKSSLGRLIALMPGASPAEAPEFGMGPREALAAVEAFLKNAEQDRANILAAKAEPSDPPEPPFDGTPGPNAP